MKIAIDLGHGVGQDRGAVGLITEESIINSVGSKVIELLRANNVEVIEVRPSSATSVSNSLIQRVDKADNNNVDLFVSLHANAGGGKGTEIYTFRAQELVPAKNVLSNLVSLGFVNRGIKGSNLYVINNTKAKAMLIEICFVDTKSDVELYNSLGATEIAKAIVKGLINQVVTSNKSTSYDFKSLQSYIGVTQDNIPGPITLRKCPLIQYGSKGLIVGWTQNRLNYLGYNCGNADNDFGEKTKAAVIAFQNRNGLVADGIVGVNTWRKLLGL